MGAYHILYAKEEYIRNLRKKIEMGYREDNYLHYEVEEELLSFLNLPDYIRSEHFDDPIAEKEEIEKILERWKFEDYRELIERIIHFSKMLFDLDYLDPEILEEYVEYEDISFGSEELIEEFIEDFERRIGVERVLEIEREVFNDWFKIKKIFWNNKSVDERMLKIIKRMEEKIEDIKYLIEEFRKDVDRKAYLYLMEKIEPLVKQLYFKMDKELLFFVIKFVLYEYLRMVKEKILKKEIHPNVLKNVVYVSEYYEEFNKEGWVNKDKAMKILFGLE